MSHVSHQQVTSDLTSAVTATLKPLGGLDKFIQPGDRVLIKPNFNTADTFPGSTDPAFLKAVSQLVSQQQPAAITIGESSTMFARTQQVIEKLGVYELQKNFPALRIVNFDQGRWIKKKIPRGRFLKSVSLPALLQEIDKIILLPCLKTHFIAQFTGSLKLAVGLMRPRERPALHLRHTQEKIAELNTAYQPDLIIMDGRQCFIRGGPGKGERRQPNLILASTDRVALDIEGIKTIQQFAGNSLAGIDPVKIPQIAHARKLGLT